MKQKNEKLKFPQDINQSELKEYDLVTKDTLKDYIAIGRIFWLINEDMGFIKGFHLIYPHIEKKCFLTAECPLFGKYTIFMKPFENKEEYKDIHGKILNNAIEDKQLYINKGQQLTKFYIK